MHSKISQQRRDWLHQCGNAIANQVNMVAVEDNELSAIPAPRSIDTMGMSIQNWV